MITETLPLSPLKRSLREGKEVTTALYNGNVIGRYGTDEPYLMRLVQHLVGVRTKDPIEYLLQRNGNYGLYLTCGKTVLQLSVQKSSKSIDVTQPPYNRYFTFVSSVANIPYDHTGFKAAVAILLEYSKVLGVPVVYTTICPGRIAVSLEGERTITVVLDDYGQV